MSTFPPFLRPQRFALATAFAFYLCFFLDRFVLGGGMCVTYACLGWGATGFAVGCWWCQKWLCDNAIILHMDRRPDDDSQD